jgi:hypothetical protein
VSATYTRQQPRYTTVPAPQPPLPADDLTLTALHSAIRIGALFAKYSAQRWGLPPKVAKIAERIAAELVTRAVKTTGNPNPHPHWSQLGELHLIGVGLRMEGRSLLVEVWDSDPTPPNSAEDHLSVVEKASQQWNCYRPPNGGKVIWAEVAYSQPQPPAPLPQRTVGCFSHPPPDEPVTTLRDITLMQHLRDGPHPLDAKGDFVASSARATLHQVYRQEPPATGCGER